MAMWDIFSFFFFEGLGRGLNPTESPNREAIGLVMFISDFVDLVESNLFFSPSVTFFGFCGQRSVPTQRATVHLHYLIEADSQQDATPVGAAPARRSRCDATCPWPLDDKMQR